MRIYLNKSENKIMIFVNKKILYLIKSFNNINDSSYQWLLIIINDE